MTDNLAFGLAETPRSTQRQCSSSNIRKGKRLTLLRERHAIPAYLNLAINLLWSRVLMKAVLKEEDVSTFALHHQRYFATPVDDTPPANRTTALQGKLQLGSHPRNTEPCCFAASQRAKDDTEADPSQDAGGADTPDIASAPHGRHVNLAVQPHPQFPPPFQHNVQRSIRIPTELFSQDCGLYLRPRRRKEGRLKCRPRSAYFILSLFFIFGPEKHKIASSPEDKVQEGMMG